VKLHGKGNYASVQEYKKKNCVEVWLPYLYVGNWHWVDLNQIKAVLYAISTAVWTFLGLFIPFSNV
jgi:hypothetical protein